MHGIDELAGADLFFLFKQAHHRLHVHVTQAVENATGVPAGQMAALVHLSRIDGALVSELGNQLGINSAGITGLALRLEAEKLVRRAPSPDDGRATRLFLTARGRAVAMLAVPLLAEHARALTAGFTAKDRALIRRFLEHVMTQFAAPPARTRARVRRGGAA